MKPLVEGLYQALNGAKLLQLQLKSPYLVRFTPTRQHWSKFPDGYEEGDQVVHI
jgi:hypothetical protein